MKGSGTKETTFMKMMNEKMMTMTKVGVLDDETIKNVVRKVVLKISAKHIYLRIR